MFLEGIGNGEARSEDDCSSSVRSGPRTVVIRMVVPERKPGQTILTRTMAWGWRVQKGKYQTGIRLGEFSGAPQDAQHLDARS